MNWDTAIFDFKKYLQLERAMTINTAEAYLNDLTKLCQYAAPLDLSPGEITPDHIQDFLAWLNSFGLAAPSQAGSLSGIKTFYLFMSFEYGLLENPTALIEPPAWRGRYRIH